MANDEETPTPFVIKVENPQVDAPVQVDVQLASIFDGVKTSLTEIVDDIKSGESAVITTIFLAGMFVFAGVFLWRQV